jgi:hypothetical protein
MVLADRRSEEGSMVAVIALAVGGLLLVIATQWDSFGESSQRWRMTGWIRHLGRMPGGWLPCVRVVR